MASSQGESTFSVFRLRPNAPKLPWLRAFEVVASAATDSVQQHSDGASVTTMPLGDGSPRGLLVVHDGENTPVVEDADGEARANTNYKYLRWDEVRSG